MKIFLPLTITLIFIGLIFQGCSKKEFNNSLSCKSLIEKLENNVSVPNGEFEEYSNDELNFFFSSTELYDDICVIYSSDNTDICEIGVLHAANEENAQKLFEDSKNYIKSIQEQKSEFLSNYSPSELKKLNSAEVRKFGNYVIFTVSEQNDKSALFQEAEMILSK